MDSLSLMSTVMISTFILLLEIQQDLVILDGSLPKEMVPVWQPEEFTHMVVSSAI